MKVQTKLSVFTALAFLALINSVNAADESPLGKFLGSPLLILVALLVIVAIAVAYHKIRK
jgi:hypothetical protein